MQTSYFKPFLFFVSFVILVGIACSFSSEQVDSTATSEVIVLPEVVLEVEEPTTPPIFESEPIETREPIQLPTTQPTDEVFEDKPAFYTEEFDEDLSSYTNFVTSGDETKMDLYLDNGYLVFDLQGEQQYVYFLYDEYTYTEVRLDVQAENWGKNKNNISLICNFSERFGWYEFAISNGGIYEIWVYSELDGGYDRLASGGSKNVSTGRDVNLYSAVCRGNQLALYVNGVLEREYIDRKYNLKDGQVGFGVSSFDVLPILVEIDYFSISEPY